MIMSGTTRLMAYDCQSRVGGICRVDVVTLTWRRAVFNKETKPEVVRGTCYIYIYKTPPVVTYILSCNIAYEIRNTYDRMPWNYGKLLRLHILL